MDKFLIIGGNKLDGKLRIDSAKNACLPILAASILTEEEVIIKKLANFSDIEVMLKILTSIGSNIKKEKNTVIINNKNINSSELPMDLTNKVRASIFMLGPMLAKFKKCKMSYPGGCNIGNRPIDIHLKGLRALGAKVIEQHGYIFASGEDMKGTDITLDFPSVGATENLIMTAVLVKGTTKINNAAREPEIKDLVNFINSMGGKISGAGSDVITIEGVKKLIAVNYTPIADRIVTGTYLIAAAMAGGKIELSGTNSNHIRSLINKLKNNGCTLQVKSDKISLSSNGNLKSIPTIETGPYPSFATDLQAPLMSLQAVSNGVSVITENLFEGRFKHVPELIKMGANITIKNNMAVVVGKKLLYGAEVTATDLRAGAGLTLAGLRAKGYTTVNDVYHIDRGYNKLEVALSKLGANIKRI